MTKLVTVHEKVHEDIFHQQRLLANKSQLYIKFTRNMDAYCLMMRENNAEFKIKIEEMIDALVAHGDRIGCNFIVFPITHVIQQELSVTHQKLITHLGQQMGKH